MDYWIVTHRPFRRHPSFAAATLERDRLGALFPAKRFLVVRCKTMAQRGGMFEALEALAARLATADASALPGLRAEASAILDRLDARRAEAREHAA